jgi:hypothetical protein
MHATPRCAVTWKLPHDKVACTSEPLVATPPINTAAAERNLAINLGKYKSVLCDFCAGRGELGLNYRGANTTNGSPTSFTVWFQGLIR